MNSTGSLLPHVLNSSCSKFAMATIKDRMPIILVKTLDDLARHKAKFGDPAKEFDDVKQVIAGISKLRYELMTDKPLAMLTEETDSPDIAVWNNVIKMYNQKGMSWFSAPWLVVECYMYRRLINMIRNSDMPTIDPFQERKREAFSSAINSISSMLVCLDATLKNLDKTIIKEEFAFYLMCSLWSNEFDLSMSAGSIVVESIDGDTDLRYDVHAKTLNNMAVNELEQIISHWPSSETPHPTSIAIAMDNAGPEMIADFILAEFLLSAGFANRIVLLPKLLPWFVSDVTPADIDWLLKDALLSFSSSSTDLQKWANRWSDRFKDGSLSISVHPFWNMPLGYNDLYDKAPDLYQQLTTEFSAVIFKGDLHYRKLLEDRAWTADSPEHKITAFRRCFPTLYASSTNIRPTPLLITLRVGKSDVVVGLSETRFSELCSVDPDWCVQSRFGFAQIVSPQ